LIAATYDIFEVSLPLRGKSQCTRSNQLPYGEVETVLTLKTESNYAKRAYSYARRALDLGLSVNMFTHSSLLSHFEKK